MSLSFGLDLDDALQNVTRAYQRASEAAVQVAKELWSPGGPLRRAVDDDFLAIS